MLKVLCCKIGINNKFFYSVSSVEIERSMKMLVDTCILELPATAVHRRNGEYVSSVPTAKSFSVGDEVVVELGYNDELQTEFRGFVKSIAPTTPTKIVCEDETFLLKKRTINKHYANATIKQIIQDCIEGTGITVANTIPDVNLHEWTIRNASAAYVLQKLIEDFALCIFFPSWKKIHVGITVGAVVQTTTKYEIGKNVVDNDLEVVDSEDTKLQLECKTILKSGEHLVVTVGDDGQYTDKTDKKRTDKTPKKVEQKAKADIVVEGEKRTMYFYNVQNKADLVKIGLAHLKKLKYTGLKGSLTCFLKPYVECGQSVSVIDNRYENRLDGIYLAEKVVVKFGEQGGRRTIYLGLKLN